MNITKAEKQARINEVFRLLITRTDRKAIHRYAVLKGWNVHPRTVDEYIAEANKEIIKTAAESRDEMLARATLCLDDLYTKSYKINDFKTCVQVMDRVIKLHGLDAPTEHKVTLTDMDQLRETINAAISADPTQRDRITAALPDMDEDDQ